MVFSSLTFLYAYLPLTLLIYFTVPLRYRNMVLLAVSLFFYGWGEPVYVLLMIFSILFNYIFGALVAKYRSTDRKKAKMFLIIDIIANLALLGFFKYFDFFAANLNMIGIRFIHPLHLGLPIGISFYTFQTMSYPIDLYRFDTDPQKKLVNFGAYVSMFPQLIAGPIVRYRDIARQLEERHENINQIYSGIQRFIIGLAKKVLLANSAGQVWEFAKGLSAEQSSLLTAWLGIAFYAFQIYFDFSGYSDMAIGLGRIFGFEFCENFNYPYIASSITDFWRRWHISLSSWFRDYVYIPLGGNRKGLKRQLVNIMIVWLLTGFWHGAAWNFVLWGVFYGIVLILEKCFLLKKMEKWPVWTRHLYTMVIVLIAWVFFADENIGAAFRYLLGMIWAKPVSASALFILRDHFVLLIVCILASTPVLKNAWGWIQQKTNGKGTYLAPLAAAFTLILCTAFIVDATYNPFLYFRF